jgi:hypothetical protein
MAYVRKGVLGPCYRCGEEGAEVCWLCHAFLCDECLGTDYENHRQEAKAHGGIERWSISLLAEGS